MEVLIALGIITTLAGGIMSVVEMNNKKMELMKLDQKTLARLTRALQQLQDNWQLPPSVVDPLQFEDFKVVSQYVPEVAKLVQEKQPQLVQERGSAREMASQRAALSDYEQLARTGDDAISRGAREQAQFEADQDLKSRRAQILRDRAARGMLGGGDSLLAELQASGQVDVSQRQQQMQAQANAQQRRMQALAAQTSLAGQMRGTNMNKEQANINIMNSFNQRMAQNQNLYNKYKADTSNRAQLENQNRQQQVYDRNTAGRTAVANQNIVRAEEAVRNRINSANKLAGMKFEGATGTAKNSAQMGANQIMAPSGSEVAASGISSIGGTATSAGINQAIQNDSNSYEDDGEYEYEDEYQLGDDPYNNRKVRPIPMK